MNKELYMRWITYMILGMDYNTWNRLFSHKDYECILTLYYADNMRLSELMDKRFQSIKAPADKVEVFTVEDYNGWLQAFMRKYTSI